MQLGTHTWMYDTIFADGAFVRSDAARHAEIVSPRSEEVIGRVPLATAADVHRAVEAARRARESSAHRIRCRRSVLIPDGSLPPVSVRAAGGIECGRWRPTSSSTRR
jgi:Aldehyde dehydrogenase family